ncbi:hypothetical protein [Catenulispora acidiphila]|nr:hypothetical protein [Catenulispora acidiphila]
MNLAPAPTADMGPYSVELRASSVFYLRRSATDGEMDESPEYVDQLFIEHAEVPMLRAALAQVQMHPHYAEGRWETSRFWLTTEPPHGYTPEQIEAANEPWEITRNRAAVVIAGPLWNPQMWPDGRFQVEVEYAKLNKLVEALDVV